MAGVSLKNGARRCFLALPLAGLFAEEAEAFLSAGRQLLPDVKWVAPEDIHATLHFFGTVTESEIQRIERAARQTALSEEPMKFSIGDIGFFPSPEKIKIIWAGLHGDLERLSRFHEKLERMLTQEGFAAGERPFAPHVTLGRTRGRGKELQFPQNLRFPQSGSKIVNKIVLFESKTLERAKTPVYAPYLCFPLGPS